MSKYVRNINSAANKNHRKPAIQKTFEAIVEEKRTLRVTKETKALQMDIDHQIRLIEDYGFRFFPNHYIHDEVIQLRAMVDQLAKHPSTQANNRRQAS